MSNIVAEWHRAINRANKLEKMFRNTECGFKKTKDYRSDEGMLHITSCTRKDHPYAKGQHIPKCIIELCPNHKGEDI